MNSRQLQSLYQCANFLTWNARDIIDLGTTAIDMKMEFEISTDLEGRAMYEFFAALEDAVGSIAKEILKED